MSKLLRIGFWVLLITNIILASWFVLHGEIHFPSDIGRDFLIFGEIAQKGIILIGGRTSSGLYHGPLWWYFNFPAYVIGQGNPITVGWFWIFLIVISLWGYFLVGKHLFNATVGYLFVLLMSVTYVYHSSAFINPHGAMLVMPFFFYFFIEYMKKMRMRDLVYHLVFLGIIIQCEMAVGIPLLLLSFPLVLYAIIKKKNYSHIFAYSVIGAFVSTWVIFDLKHQFLLTKQALHFANPQEKIPGVTLPGMIQDRITNFLYKIEFIREDHGFLNIIPLAATFVFIAFQIKDKKNKLIYLSFTYFLIGFFVLSLINKGGLLSFYLYPLFPLVFLIFASFATSRYKTIFFVFFAVIYILNTQTAFKIIPEAQQYIGKNRDSWKLMYTVASQMYNGHEHELGYFVFSPDAYGYALKYAAVYAARTHPDKQTFPFQKRHVTYIAVAPLAQDNPFIQDKWWQENKLNLKGNPVMVEHFAAGFKLEKFILTDQDTKIPFDSEVDLGLHFR